MLPTEAESVFRHARAPVSMSLWCYRVCLLVTALATLGCLPQTTPAQESGKIVVPLQIASPYQQIWKVAGIRFDEGNSIVTPNKMKPETIRIGHLPGGLRVAVETVAESPNAYRVQIDTDDDNDLADESPMLLNVASSVKVDVMRRLGNGKSVSLPYTISYERRTDGQQAREYFYWRPNYVATGKLKSGDCEASVKVLDVNGDAVFDRHDFRQATTIYIDDGSKKGVINLNDPRVVRNRDGSIEIPEELRRIKTRWHKGEETIEVCGGFYLVDNVEPDGSLLTLAKAQLKIPTVGAALPTFAMTTLDGRVIDAKSLKGSVTLLDFWASWCRPCVEKFGEVKRMVEAYKGDMKVIAINVDDSARLSAAHQVIKEYKLTWPHVASGQGERDPLWKVFGSMSNNGLAIPLYVLIDSNGIIRYAGNGDTDLSELRARIKDLESNKSVQPK